MVFLSDEKHLIPSNLKKGDWKNERKNKVARQADTGQEIRSFLPFSPDCIVTFFCPLYTLLREWFAGPPARFNFGILVALSPWIRLIVGLRYALPPSTGCVRNILPWKKWSRVQKETSPFPEIETILENPFPLLSKRNIALNVGEFARHEWIQIPIAFSTKEKKISFKHELSERRFLRKRKRGRWMFFSFFTEKQSIWRIARWKDIYFSDTPCTDYSGS